MEHTKWIGAGIATTIFVVLGLVSMWAGQPLLVPSLGPAVFIQVEQPRQAAGKPWNTLAGHAIGLAAGVVALALIGAHAPSPIFTGVLTWQREMASALGIGLSFVGQLVLKASHPPAAASTLLVTLGATAPEWRGIAMVAAGVLVTSMLARTARHVAMRGSSSGGLQRGDAVRIAPTAAAVPNQHHFH